MCDNYKNKYLKYKNKYLLLKNQYGSSSSQTTNIVNYEKGVVYKKNVSEPVKDTDLDSFPYRNLLFQNAVFANLILYYKLNEILY